MIQTYFSERIQPYTTPIKTCNGISYTKNQAQIPCFPNFISDYQMNVILFKLHDTFQGLIDFEDIVNLKFQLDFEHQVMYNELYKSLCILMSQRKSNI